MQTKIRLAHQRILVLGLFFIADRLLKNIIWFSLPKGEKFLFIQPFLNSDIAFSLPIPGGSNSILLIILLLITFVVLWEAIRLYRSNDFLFFWWGMIAIGASSNILDRIQLGGVLDYIDFGFFPVFNMSDTYISLGVAVIVATQIKLNRLRKSSRRS